MINCIIDHNLSGFYVGIWRLPWLTGVSESNWKNITFHGDVFKPFFWIKTVSFFVFRLSGRIFLSCLMLLHHTGLQSLNINLWHLELEIISGASSCANDKVGDSQFQSAVE